MKFYRAGDHSTGICEACRSKVVTRMEYRDYRPPDWDVTVPGVLVAVCDKCNQVVGIPHQSTPRINDYRKVKPDTHSTVSIGARVPREIEEALDLVTVTLGGPAKAIRPAVIRYYLTQMGKQTEVAQAVKRQAASIVKGPANRRIVVKVTSGQWAKVLKASKRAGIKSKSDLIRGVALLAAEDCQIDFGGSAAVIDKKSRNRRAFLKQLVGTM
jgi:hypothetical protein